MLPDEKNAISFTFWLVVTEQHVVACLRGRFRRVETKVGGG